MRVGTSGTDIGNAAFGLAQALISYIGVTDANGSALGITLVSGPLANEPSYDGLVVKILSGPAAGQVRTIEVHNGNTLTVGVPFTNPAGAAQQITIGTLFVILSSLAGGGGPGPASTEGLSYYGVVDAVPGGNQFTIGGLAGLGAGKFDGATMPYYAFVVRDAGGAGAAPQGQSQVVTAYDTGTGTFTTAAFGAAVAVGDEVLIIHQYIWQISDIYATRLTAARAGYLDNINQAGLLQVSAARMGYLDSLNSGVLVGSYTAAVSKLAGVPQNFTKNINSAANAGDVVVATVTAQSCFIKRIVLRSNGATTADLTNAAIYGGAGKVVTFIDSVTGVRANIAAVDQQVSWGGAATLPATKTIVISLTGTGATAVNLQVDIELFAIVDGGYLA